ncbi:hypothetical protein ONS96_014057 [Cadophora gregata f. sp. sojae]|nr:hypothetical protein ONS96_014057 [Cadophora gregata f. sp. sojae]
MRLSWLLALPAVLSTASALAIQRRDADFYSVRTHVHKDMSGKKGDPTDKYFHESIFHPHYDGRFADHQLGYQERKQALSNLIQTYLATFADIGVETWLMHGTLLGWWWNRKILPWDSDLDVQVTEASMHYLASYYNMSVFHYKTPRIPEGRDYMLEVNPHYVNREQSDNLNVIDARWVDTTSGLFIDITTARYNLTHPAGKGMLSCKDGHEYRDSYIFPLRDTYFEGTPAKIPFAYKEVLEAEYKQRALTNTNFEGHHFDDQKYEWLPVPEKEKGQLKSQEPKREQPKKEVKKDEPAKKAAPPVVQAQQQTKNEVKPPTQQVVPSPKKDDSASPATQKPADSSPEKPEVSKRAAPPQQPASQRAAEKLSKKEQKREDVRRKTEEKRKTLELKAIAKEEKRLASQKKADEKRAAAEGKAA